VRQAEGQPSNPQPLGHLLGSPAQVQLRPLPGKPANFKLQPAHAAADAGSQRLCAGFLGRKSGRQALGRVLLLALAILNLPGREDAPQKCLAIALHTVRDALNLDQVCAKSDDQGPLPCAGSLAFSVRIRAIVHTPHGAGEPRTGASLTNTRGGSDAVAACNTTHVPAPISDITCSKRGTMKPEPLNVAEAALLAETPVIELRGRSFEDHQEFVPTLLETMASCGCWLLERRELPPNVTELRFEVLLRSVFELYSGLLSCGIELSRDSHTRMKSLCTVRDHNPHRARRRRVLTVRLELICVEEPDCPSDLAQITMGRA
jgi:hypothetical protein